MCKLPLRLVVRCPKWIDADREFAGRAKEKLAQGKSLPRTLELLAIKSTGLISFVKIREIDWIEAADYYACLHLAGKTHLLRRSIADLEQDVWQYPGDVATDAACL